MGEEEESNFSGQCRVGFRMQDLAQMNGNEFCSLTSLELFKMDKNSTDFTWSCVNIQVLLIIEPGPH